MRMKADNRKSNKKNIGAYTKPGIAKRSEILFFYDARMCNPNGDPDENRPRIDRLTKRNIVTEFRLKRTIRDYIYNIIGSKNRVPKKKILMRQELASPSQSRELKYLEDLTSEYITYHKKGSKEPIKKEEYLKLSPKDRFMAIDKDRLLIDHIDIRLFGILFAVEGIHFKTIGPVQFSLGQSLNEVGEDIPIRLTRIVPNTRKEAEGTGETRGSESGTFGEKYIIRYSFIQFHGFVNNNVAEEVNLTELDIRDMLTAAWRGTDSLSTSSKFGQKSRLLIKVNYKNNGYIGDLDLKSKLENAQNDGKLVQNVSQIGLNIKDLLELLTKNKLIIESIEYEYNPELLCISNKKDNFGTLISDWANKSVNSGVKVNRLNL
jgi:CRISPR-associated protein Csh2